ncbi:MAG: MotA/TolQ/ExbB proton channel family protein [Deltaproteobacteria bacterium]|nr:MotA/TolQ/ExbB proton channel family protein [Deltaproteobacteria bacterium]
MLAKSLFNMTLVGAEWVLYFLVALSLASLAIVIERAIYLALNRTDAKRLSREIAALLKEGDEEGALAMLRKHNAPEARITIAGLRDTASGIGAVEERVAAAVNVEKAMLERGLAFLGTVGSNAPFIGLFGTVLGIIKAFHDLSLGSKEGAAAVMSGISEALVATAVGLLVAIPAVMAFNWFKRKAAERMLNADTLVREVLAYLKSGPRLTTND